MHVITLIEMCENQLVKKHKSDWDILILEFRFSWNMSELVFFWNANGIPSARLITHLIASFSFDWLPSYNYRSKYLCIYVGTITIIGISIFLIPRTLLCVRPMSLTRLEFYTVSFGISLFHSKCYHIFSFWFSSKHHWHVFMSWIFS